MLQTNSMRLIIVDIGNGHQNVSQLRYHRNKLRLFLKPAFQSVIILFTFTFTKVWILLSLLATRRLFAFDKIYSLVSVCLHGADLRGQRVFYNGGKRRNKWGKLCCKSLWYIAVKTLVYEEISVFSRAHIADETDFVLLLSEFCRITMLVAHMNQPTNSL